jgi:hypothetical protein
MNKWQKQGLIPYTSSYLSWERTLELLEECKKNNETVVKVLKLYENGKKYGKIIVVNN